MEDKNRKRLFLLAAFIVLTLFFAQGLAFINANSQTSDEACHLAAGYSYLATRDFRLNPEHPVLIKELSALPLYLWYRLPFNPDRELWEGALKATLNKSPQQWLIGQSFVYESSVSADNILFMGRLPNLFLGTLLVALIGWWSYRLWGKWAALMGMSLAALEPNLVAHSSLITTDLGITLFIFMAIYLTWEYVSSPSLLLLISIGVVTGLALVTKYSGIVLPVMIGAIVFCLVLAEGTFPPTFVNLLKKPNFGSKIINSMTFVISIVLLALLVIPFFYFFTNVSIYWTGLTDVLLHNRQGHEAFFFGEYSMHGWRSYFLAAFLIKTPIGSLVLILASLIFFRAGRSLTLHETIFLLMPAVIYFSMVSLSSINIGLRHALPVYPFLFVIASRLATIRIKQAGLKLLLLGIPLLYTTVSTLNIAPHHLAYFNEIPGGPDKGYLYINDSNIDWGQGLKGLKKYMEREKIPMIYFSYFGNAPPSGYDIKYQYIPGFGNLIAPPMDTIPHSTRREILAISVMNLLGVQLRNKDMYQWLNSRSPIAKIGYSIFIYDITGDSEAHLRLADAYLKQGPWQLAIPELRKALAIDPNNKNAARILQKLVQELHSGEMVNNTTR